MTDTPIDQDLTQRVQEFLEALSELSQRTGIMITGCERCGAPRLQIEHPSRERGALLVAVKMRGYLANSPRELTVPVEANQR